MNETKNRLETASNELKLTAGLIPSTIEIREDLTEAVNQLNETVGKTNEVYEKRELELPLVSQLQEKAMIKADELSNQAANFELKFAETRGSTQQAVDAAKSYQDILKSLDLARKAAENASIAGLNSLEETNGLHDQAKSARSDSANLGRNATKVRANLVNDVEAKLKEREEELKATQQLLDKQNEREKLLNAEMSKINLKDLRNQVEEAKTKADAAQKQGQEIREKIEEIQNRLPQLRYETGNQSTVISVATRDSQSIREQLERARPLIPEAKKALEEVKLSIFSFQKQKYSL